MCGFAGIYSTTGIIDQTLLWSMTDLIKHRGPDDEGYLLINTSIGTKQHLCGKDSIQEIKALYPPIPTKTKANLGFGFRRLSIIDLSPAGHQPMAIEKCGLSIVFNGEIYNYRELRQELKSHGCHFTTNSDTEVIMHAYHAWGESCTSRFIGMWALVIWDQNKQRLFCSRDPFGIKPLYYTLQGSTIFFASELKQLRLCINTPKLNHLMLQRSLRINALQVYGSETYWLDFKALAPANNMIFANGTLSFNRYFRLEPEQFESSTLSFSAAVEQYRTLFLDSIALQLRSDVEVGSCLSGGLDSSAIVCSASKITSQPLQTVSSYYSIDPSLDERKWILMINKQTGCKSSLVSPSIDDAISCFDHATYINDIPLGAGFASQYAVMKTAKENGIKVLLDGQGSDEQTAGYSHSSYRYFADLIRKTKYKRLVGELPSYLRGKTPSSALSSVAKILLSAVLSESKLYRLEFKHYRFNPFDIEYQRMVMRHNSQNILSEIKDLKASRLSNFLYNMMQNTSIQTLLHYEDRMSMAHSIESRVPFLDHRLVTFSFSLPSHYKVKPPLYKYIHREAMKDIVPKAIYDRRDKSIFSSPFYSTWMRGGFAPYIESILYSESFRKRGIWNLPLIQSKWRSYQKGNPKPAEMLFNIIAMEQWFRIHEDSPIQNKL